VHPLVRIVSFLVFTAIVSSARPGTLVSATLILVFGSRPAMKGGLRGLNLVLRRVRWLLLSLLIIYGWLTPGTPLLPGLGVFSPTFGGLYHGALRIWALLLIVIAVHLLLQLTGRYALTAALLQLVKPMRYVGIAPERFAVRMVLVMEAVPQVQQLVNDAVRTKRGTASGLALLEEKAARVYQAVLQRCEKEREQEVVIPASSPVPYRQWLAPLALAALLLFAAQVPAAS
jgi:energy-coupling factor transporter transmembrane protein EcfT